MLFLDIRVWWKEELERQKEDSLMDELVSIITPSYNTADYLIETVLCVRNQTYKNWEMIIVDDNSSDQTHEKIRPFLTDNRIRYFENKKNIGAALCRNIALKEAKGRWIAFLDSDDLWSPDKLEKQIEFMKENNYHFSYTNYKEIDEHGKSLGVTWTGPKRVGRIKMMLFNFIGCLTVIYDRDYVGLVQIVNIRKRNDYAIWEKVVKKCPAYLLKECLASYRVRKSGSITNRGANPLQRFRYNYDLWHLSEGYCPFFSLLLTGVNLFFGIIKKVIYKRTSNQ